MNDVSSIPAEQEILGHSRKLQDVMHQVGMVGPTDTTVLILGETGTGKELFARLIHNVSPRRAQVLVKLNCTAIPLGLLESELFGHERGAFTGAINRRIGRFELANKGTLFLDEIGDIPAEVQPKLLRVLQEHEFERLGSAQIIHTNARLIAATHCDLGEMVRQKQFRSDLYYRLSVFPITLPPLRERVDDIPLLTWHFVTKFSKQMGKTIESIPAQVMDTLQHHAWPGNIRELQSFIHRAVILSRGPVLEPSLAELRGFIAEPVTMRDAERAHILRTLQETNGVVSRAAARLGLPRSTLFYKMRRLGISASREQTARRASISSTMG